MPSVLQSHGVAVQELQRVMDENERLRAALMLIAAMEGKTLLGWPSGDECDRAHQIGANKAFNQAAEIARSVLHDSDCATNNAPALPVGECDCSLTQGKCGAGQE